MKLIVNRNIMFLNIEKAERLSNGRRVALMFKDEYADFFDKRFLGHVCFGNNIGSSSVSYNIFDEQIRSAKVCTPTTPILGSSTIYVPIDTGDCREGLDVFTATQFIKDLREKGVENIFGLITNGCTNDVFATKKQLEEIYVATGVKLSVGGSFVLDKIDKLPDCVEEIRIGEYMLFGTIPGSKHYEKFGDSAIQLEQEVGASYHDRGHILVKGGSSFFEASKSELITGSLKLIHQSSDYTIYKDINRVFRNGDKVYSIPDYSSLKLLKNVERKYI